MCLVGGGWHNKCGGCGSSPAAVHVVFMHVNHVCGVVHDLQQIHPLHTPQGVLCWGEEGGVLYNCGGRVAPDREGRRNAGDMQQTMDSYDVQNDVW